MIAHAVPEGFATVSLQVGEKVVARANAVFAVPRSG